MLRRAGLCALLTGAFGATLGIGSGPAGGATGRQAPPEVAIGQVRQAWNSVEVDYGLADANTAKLQVVTPNGDEILADLKQGVSGTLVWDRKVQRVHAPLGRYRLDVVAAGAGGENQTSKFVTLGLLYTDRPVLTRFGIKVTYQLAEDATVEMLLRTARGASIVVEHRQGRRGPNQLTWNLHYKGKRVAGGKYRIQLVATTGSGVTQRTVLGGAGR